MHTSGPSCDNSAVGTTVFGTQSPLPPPTSGEHLLRFLRRVAVFGARAGVRTGLGIVTGCAQRIRRTGWRALIELVFLRLDRRHASGNAASLGAEGSERAARRRKLTRDGEHVGCTQIGRPGTRVFADGGLLRRGQQGRRQTMTQVAAASCVLERGLRRGVAVEGTGGGFLAGDRIVARRAELPAVAGVLRQSTRLCGDVGQTVREAAPFRSRDRLARLRDVRRITQLVGRADVRRARASVFPEQRDLVGRDDARRHAGALAPAASPVRLRRLRRPAVATE